MARVLRLLSLDPRTVKAAHHTRADGKVLPVETRNKRVTDANVCFYENGFFIEKDAQNGQYEVTSYTLCDGRHVLNFSCTLSAEGALLRGRVNCFALGFMPISEDYLEDVWEYISSQGDKFKWDRVDLVE